MACRIGIAQRPSPTKKRMEGGGVDALLEERSAGRGDPPRKRAGMRIQPQGKRSGTGDMVRRLVQVLSEYSSTQGQGAPAPP